MGETAPDEKHPSLLHQLRARRSPPSARRLRWLRLMAGGVLITLALVAIVAGVLAGRARREAIGLSDAVMRAGAAREADRTATALFAGPGLGEELAAVAVHLPPGTRLASAARGEGGGLTIAIDSADPDALRQTLRADPWFAAFRERGQSASEDGTIRVTFERAP